MDGVYFYLVEREDESPPLQQKMLQNGVRIWAVERVKLACKRQGEKSSPEANTPLLSLLQI